ncbi:protein white-like [Babylonia areolata]|uniref:protein white-like n=1 Tax=Babylonia areolata TaxID=304850 RepID=UPI003FD1E889
MACELLSNRPLVLCDDPTWDLDPATARDTLRALRTLAERQHTVICSVLHPSSWSWSWSWWWWWWWTSSQAHVFSCFHKVLLLMEGHTAFMGTSSEALAFFSSLGHVNPQHLNPADFLLETPTLTTPLMAKAISEAFLKTSYAQEMLTCIQTLTRDGVTQTHEIQQMLLSSVRRPASWWEQVKGNVWRFWTVGKRERRWLFFNCFATSLFVGLLFLRLDWTGYTQSHVLNVNGALFLITSVVCCTTTHTFVSVFPGWVPIVLRDHHDRLYRLDVFYLTAVLMGLPWMLRVPLFTISVDYWIVGLVRHTSNFLTAVGICCLAASVSMAFGLAVSTVTGGEVRVAAWWSNAITFPLLLVSGFLVNVGSIPDWLQWVGFVSWFRHTNELLMVNQWNEVERIACRSDGNGSGCLFQEGAEVLRYFHLGSENCLRNYVSLVVLSVVFHALAFVALCFRARCWNRS